MNDEEEEEEEEEEDDAEYSSSEGNTNLGRKLLPRHERF
jgi:hypothetical protein